MEYFLGIHCGHDATATLLDEEGKIIASIAEERITRVNQHISKNTQPPLANQSLLINPPNK